MSLSCSILSVNPFSCPVSRILHYLSYSLSLRNLCQRSSQSLCSEADLIYSASKTLSSRYYYEYTRSNSPKCIYTPLSSLSQTQLIKLSQSNSTSQTLPVKLSQSTSPSQPHPVNLTQSTSPIKLTQSTSTHANPADE